jgi:hypothetical protein
MKNSVQDVLAGRVGYFKACKSFGVPQTTLEASVKKARTGLSLEDATKKGNYYHLVTNMLNVFDIKKLVTSLL